MCVYICIHVPICVCMHVCTGVCAYVCEHTCVMCTFPGIGHPTRCKSILLSWYCLQSRGVFLLEVLWPDTIPTGGLDMPTMPSPYSFST